MGTRKSETACIKIKATCFCLQVALLEMGRATPASHRQGIHREGRSVYEKVNIMLATLIAQELLTLLVILHALR